MVLLRQAFKVPYSSRLCPLNSFVYIKKPTRAPQSLYESTKMFQTQNMNRNLEGEREDHPSCPRKKSKLLYNCETHHWSKKKYKILENVESIDLIKCPSDSGKTDCTIGMILIVTAALTNLCPSVEQA